MNTLRMSEARSRRSMLGITLLELMTVVMVIGILGVIALPSYRQYMMRAQRTEAKNALLQLQTNQERFYLANRTYSGDPDALGFPGDLTERGSYTLSIAGANANGYTATATPRAGADINMTEDAQCTTFSLTAQGVRTATGSDPTRCW
jgi:type IV pilus assembly protein PilE